MRQDAAVKENQKNDTILDELETDSHFDMCFCSERFKAKKSRKISEADFCEILKAENPIYENCWPLRPDFSSEGILKHRFEWFFKTLEWNKFIFNNRDALRGFELYLNSDSIRPLVASTYNEVSVRYVFYKCLKNQIDAVLSMFNEDCKREILNSES